jgi:hypothetical protein
LGCLVGIDEWLAAATICEKPSVVILEDEGDPNQPYPEKQTDHPSQGMTFDNTEPKADQYEDQTKNCYE